MKTIFGILALFCFSSVTNAGIPCGGTATTTAGAIFKRVCNHPSFGGETWKDPSGTVWSDALQYQVMGSFNKPEFLDVELQKAIDGCKDIGGRLPTADEFSRLADYMSVNTPNGKYYSPQILPHLKNRNFWTSDRDTDPRLTETYYLYFMGDIGFSDPMSPDDHVNVRCVTSN